MISRISFSDRSRAHSVRLWLRLLALPLLTVGLTACQPGGEDPEPTLVVENGRVIVGDGPVLEGASVAIAGDSILSITKDSVEAPNARRIDASGKSVLPGLIDAHVHLTAPRTGGDSTALAQHLDERVPEVFRSFLDHGVTTVRSTGDLWPWIGHLRDSVAAGALAGPRIKTAGPILTTKGGHPATTACRTVSSGDRPDPFCEAHLAREVTEPQEARNAVRELANEGVDFIKFVSDSIIVRDPVQIKNSAVRAIIDQAHEDGLKAVGHVAEPRYMERYAEMGIDGFVHPFSQQHPWTDDRLRRLGKRLAKHQTPVTTTAAILLNTGKESTGPVIGGTFPKRDRIEEIVNKVSLLWKAGVPIVIGTDWVSRHVREHPALQPGAKTITEMRIFRWGGISQEAIIKAATVTAARALEMEDRVGTLEEGKLADLLVMDGNPLEDLSALEDPEVVVQGGEVVAAD